MLTLWIILNTECLLGAKHLNIDFIHYDTVNSKNRSMASASLPPFVSLLNTRMLVVDTQDLLSVPLESLCPVHILTGWLGEGHCLEREACDSLIWGNRSTVGKASESTKMGRTSGQQLHVKSTVNYTYGVPPIPVGAQPLPWRQNYWHTEGSTDVSSLS
jgi:hypothetical protein